MPDLYVSSVEGHAVTRYGTRELIGASRRADAPTVIEWDTAAVVCITESEHARFRREYDNAIRRGSLVEIKDAPSVGGGS